DGAKVIVEAYVQSVDLAAPPARGGPIPRNDVLLIPVRVLKGPEALGQFAVDQIRASGFFEMQPGQHFILFLNDLDPRGAQLFPERPGIPRYNVVLAAILCIDAGKIRVSPEGNYMRARFEGVDLEKAVADIQSYVRIQRVSGRIVVDSGAFPPAGSLFNVYRNAIDNPGNLKVVLTPVASAGISPGTVPRPTVAVHANPVTGLGPARPIWLGSLPPVVETRASLDAGPRITFVDRGGAFILPMDAGSYRVTVDGLPFGYYLKSISYGSRDLLVEPLRIDGTGEAAAADLIVTLTDKAPSTAPAGVKVSGRVTGIPSVQLALNLWITLMSDSAESVRASAVQFTSDGVFEFRNVPPGRYTLRTTEQLLAPAGTAFGGPSIVPVAVAGRDIAIELPLFTGVEVTAQVVDRNNKPTVINGLFLTITPIGGPAESTITMTPSRDGLYRFWLSRGEYTIQGRPLGGAASVTAITGGSVDLLKTPLKIDGVSKVEPIRIKVE